MASAYDEAVLGGFRDYARQSRAGDGADPGRRSDPAPWPEPDLSLLETRRTPASACPLEVFGPWEGWIRNHAEVTSGPADYVAGSLLCVAGATVANTL